MARIAIDLRRRIGPVDRRIFGNVVEHLGRCPSSASVTRGEYALPAHSVTVPRFVVFA
jgi:hypothetical protein